MYKIKTEQFEGPLELLLELIKKEELDITRLSLAKITGEYLDFLENNRDKITLSHLADFLVIASKLILIKSKALLPILELTEEEEEEIRDLEEQLVEYKKFKEASQKLKNLLALKKNSFSRDREAGSVINSFFPPPNVDVNKLHQFFQKVISEIPEQEKLKEEVVQEVISLEDRIVSIKKIIHKRVSSSFSQLAKNSNNKIEVIISFLAVLEMTKQKVIEARQEGLFKEIEISKV